MDVKASALPTGAATGAKQDTGNTSLSSIDGKITACNTGAVVLAAGAAAIGKLAANSGVDIGDVDVTSCALPTGAATAAKQPALGTAGTPSADVISVQGVVGGTTLPVSDGGGALTVDGTVAVTNAGITTIAGAVSGTEMQVDVVAALPAGTNAIGKLAANSGVDIGDVDILSIAAGDNNIGNVDIATIAAGDNNIGNVDIASAIPAGTNIIGAVKRDVVNYTPIRKYYANTGAAIDGIVWSPAAGKKWVITDIALTTSAAATVTLEDDKAGGDAVVMAFDLAANGGVSTNFQTPIMSEENDADLIITTSAGNIKIMVAGYEV